MLASLPADVTAQFAGMPPPPPTPRRNPERVWSAYQQAVFDFDLTQGNLLIQAVAGSGKTTTLVELARRTAENYRVKIGFMAFNTAIKDELRTRLGKAAKAQTFHGAGFSAIYHAMGKIPLDDNKARDTLYKMRSKHAVPQAAIPEVIATWDLCTGTCTDLTNPEDVALTLEEYGRELEHLDAVLHLLPLFHQAMLEDTTRIAYGEMLTWPLEKNLPLPQYDLLLVDEAQDLNLQQLKFTRRMIKPDDGRLVACGDRQQAIYAFRGAAAGAMDMLRIKFQCTELPLSICYRCGARIVAKAQSWSSCIEAAPGAPEGRVIHVGAADLGDTLAGLAPGDMVLGRRNAPLVKLTLQLLRNGTPARMRGRDIGQGLRMLIDKARQGLKDDCVDVMVQQVVLKCAREAQKARKADRDAQADVWMDRAAAVVALCDGFTSITAVLTQLDSLFSDGLQGVILSSIHKAKGLEADKVVWVEPELCEMFARRAQEKNRDEDARQERNLQYVACTRAKSVLVLQSLGEEGLERGPRGG